MIIAGSVTDEEAKKIWPQGFKAPRPYIRIVPQPQRLTDRRLHTKGADDNVRALIVCVSAGSIE